MALGRDAPTVAEHRRETIASLASETQARACSQGLPNIVYEPGDQVSMVESPREIAPIQKMAIEQSRKNARFSTLPLAEISVLRHKKVKTTTHNFVNYTLYLLSIGIRVRSLT